MELAMAAITIGTFNVQNLFFRYEQLDQVKKGFKVVGVDPDKLTINDFKRILSSIDEEVANRCVMGCIRAPHTRQPSEEQGEICM